MTTKQVKTNRESKFYNEYPCCRIRKRITEELQWTLTEAAEKMKNAGIENVTVEAVRQWTGGYSRPDMNKLKDLARVLDCSINYLFGVDDLPDMTDNQINQILGLDKGIKEIKYHARQPDKTKIKILDKILGTGVTGKGADLQTILDLIQDYEKASQKARDFAFSGKQPLTKKEIEIMGNGGDLENCRLIDQEEYAEVLFARIQREFGELIRQQFGWDRKREESLANGT